jgi:hypothetical protein
VSHRKHRHGKGAGPAAAGHAASNIASEHHGKSAHVPGHLIVAADPSDVAAAGFTGAVHGRCAGNHGRGVGNGGPQHPDDARDLPAGARDAQGRAPGLNACD